MRRGIVAIALRARPRARHLSTRDGLNDDHRGLELDLRRATRRRRIRRPAVHLQAGGCRREVCGEARARRAGDEALRWRALEERLREQSSVSK